MRIAEDPARLNQTDALAQVSRPLPTAKARVGQISFINSLPIVLPITAGVVPLDAKLTLAAPSQLNAMFAADQLDLGAMSTFFFLKRCDFQLIPGVSISSAGEVGSVLFFSKVEKPTRALASNLSATSVNLLKMLFIHDHGLAPELEGHDNPDLDAPDVEAVLVIGDRALAADQKWSHRYKRIDLGAWWWQTFQVPMVFGVWAAKSTWVNANAVCFQRLCSAFVRAKNEGLTTLFNDVLSEAEARTGLDRQRLETYFRQQLNFELTSAHIEGLNLYRSLAVDMKLLA